MESFRSSSSSPKCTSHLGIGLALSSLVVLHLSPSKQEELLERKVSAGDFIVEGPCRGLWCSVNGSLEETLENIFNRRPTAQAAEYGVGCCIGPVFMEELPQFIPQKREDSIPDFRITYVRLKSDVSRRREGSCMVLHLSTLN